MILQTRSESEMKTPERLEPQSGRTAAPNGFMRDSSYTRFGKRCFDLTASALGVVLISPVFLLAALAVKFSSRGPIFFRQIRIGQFGRPYSMFKFRSMRAGESRGSQLTALGDPRITPLGSWLRRTKIDELPQLFNVI